MIFVVCQSERGDTRCYLSTAPTAPPVPSSLPPEPLRPHGSQRRSDAPPRGSHHPKRQGECLRSPDKASSGRGPRRLPISHARGRVKPPFSSHMAGSGAEKLLAAARPQHNVLTEFVRPVGRSWIFVLESSVRRLRRRRTLIGGLSNGASSAR